MENKNTKVRILIRTFSYYKIKIWKDKKPPLAILIFSLVSALFMLIPVLYVIYRAITGDASDWSMIVSTRLPSLMVDTVKLALSVTISSVIIGVALAWLINRTDIPFANFFRIAMAIPMAIPPYVGALTYIILFGPMGQIRRLIGRPLFNIYGFFGVSLVMTLFSFPYVYLIVSAAVQRLSSNYEEAGLSCGMSYKKVFYKIVLPLLKPSIVSGALLVALYIFSDFGAIAMLRYNTFASAIYYQMTGRFNMSRAAILSMVLMVITISLIIILNKQKQNLNISVKSSRKPNIIKLGKWKGPSLLFVLLVFTLSIGIPFYVLINWSIRGITSGALDERFLRFTWNSFYGAGIAAIISMLVTVPLVYLKSRYPSFITEVINKSIYSGYVLPGVITSLGLIFFFLSYLPVLYTTPIIVITAFVVRFLPQSMQAGEGVISMVPESLDEAGRSLGKSETQVMTKIILPMIMPGILSGGALVFINSLKELTTTLILRPAGFDTLAVRIWLEASEGFYEMAAPAALLIVLISIIPLKLMLRKY